MIGTGNKTFIGVDLGGTNFKVALVKGPQILSHRTVGIDRDSPKEVLVGVLYKLIEELWSDQVIGIGVGVPGLVDKQTNTLFDLQNIPSWKEVNLGSLLEERFGRPVAMDNDANCFALAENYFGQGQAFSNFAAITLGTGLGMGLVINDRLHSGELSGAGELGMIPYRDSIVEHYAGSFFFTREYGATGSTLFNRAQNGDKEALQAFGAFGEHLGYAIKIVLGLIAPRAVILGGAISQAFPYFNQSMREELSDFAYPRLLERLTILPASSVHSPLIGAAALCLDKQPG